MTPSAFVQGSGGGGGGHTIHHPVAPSGYAHESNWPRHISCHKIDSSEQMYRMSVINEPRHDISNNVVYATSKTSD